MLVRDVVVFFPNVVLKFQNIFKITRKKNLVSLCKRNNEMLVSSNWKRCFFPLGIRSWSTQVTPHERPALTSDWFYALMDWVEGSCRSSLILLSQSDFYSMPAALLILLPSRGVARLALQLLMPLLAQLRTAPIKRGLFSKIFFFLRTGITPRSNPTQITNQGKKNIPWALHKPNISQ